MTLHFPHIDQEIMVRTLKSFRKSNIDNLTFKNTDKTFPHSRVDDFNKSWVISTSSKIGSLLKSHSLYQSQHINNQRRSVSIQNSRPSRTPREIGNKSLQRNPIFWFNSKFNMKKSAQKNHQMLQKKISNNSDLKGVYAERKSKGFAKLYKLPAMGHQLKPKLWVSSAPTAKWSRGWGKSINNPQRVTLEELYIPDDFQYFQF